jgi:hypothetical protein
MDGLDISLTNNRNEPTPLVITLGGHKANGPAGPGVTPFEFKRTLMDSFGDINYIFVRDLMKSWYFQGIDGLSRNYRENVRELRSVLTRVNFNKSMIVGSSSGGFASILYGVLLGVDQVVAFGPQTFICKEKLKRYNEIRWRCDECFLDSEEYKKINHKYYDLSELRHRRYDTNIKIIVDKNYKPDLPHVNNISGLKNVTIDYIDGPGTHSVAGYLKTENKLLDYFNFLVDDR